MPLTRSVTRDSKITHMASVVDTFFRILTLPISRHVFLDRGDVGFDALKTLSGWTPPLSQALLDVIDEPACSAMPKGDTRQSLEHMPAPPYGSLALVSMEIPSHVLLATMLRHARGHGDETGRRFHYPSWPTLSAP